ncbi:hypothetical protein VSS74_17690 [Conexibacter stalactiti]|uniref:SecDF P1 head subdomain domain-containing protein n=1 Tax=Conexibacter stalactiti TaxID=1940611 RepID=A0ABU4HS96_9ACTN|nr:hypothetical protein [Conexibacter stalactiti]MDW5596185.1 hypothetical protein [Conexibacter stalactiti]MEC5036827.1 hypothetical protein [Conexibacter stalactiti]
MSEHQHHAPRGRATTASGGGDPLARIGERLVGAAVERRRRRRHARQRIAGAAVTVTLLAAVLVVARPFDGGSPLSPAARVELAVPGGSFEVFANEHGALCANRPNGRDAAGMTSCSSPELLRPALERDGLAWLAARVDGDRVVVTGLAETGAERVVLSMPAARGGQGPSGATLLRERPVTISTVGERLTARPFGATLPRGGGVDVHVDVVHSDGRVMRQTIRLGAVRPSGFQPGRSLVYRVERGRFSARYVGLAQARLEAIGPGPSQVVGDGNRLTVELPSRTPEPAADARAALAPGVLRFYDWEASVLLTDGRSVAEGLADGAARATSISRTAGASGGMRLGLARTLAQVPENLSRPHDGLGTVVQALDGGRRSPLPRDDPRARFYVLRGRPALTGAELVHPRAATNASGQPDVRFDLTAEGRREFHRATRAIARRGQSLMLPGVSAAEIAQHFAVVLDGRLLSIAAIDPQRLPDGIDGDDGALIAGGFTARDAERLARLLSLGTLPAMRELR